MTTVTSTQYYDDLKNFIIKHTKKGEYKVYTSPFENGQYHKDYAFEDGSMFTEVNEMNYEEEVEIVVHGLTIKKTVKLIKHEYWSTEFGSRYWFEAR